MAKKPSCATCYFFRADDPKDPKHKDGGWCQKHPPRVIETDSPHHAARILMTVWPLIETPLDQWCGEHKPK